ncbi:hypothetical protein MB02_14735 [Croceicoccus estronivorus]|uniref:hypothetical protein n=1 Tax=Croceicoccus estronivorus TaxID=1172626 RepID=UPI000832D51A|nr:hypothetical protein [Croceicoccus estronivorus]OCC22684.1 hypothetical protein MB02_14735 [Croceicoccus estronivorus]
MKFSKLAAIAALATAGVPASAWAQAPAEANQGATLTAGATVYDPQGEVVGTIAEIRDDVVIIDTGTNKATLGAASFADGPNGPMIGATKAELDSAVEAAAAKAAAALDAALQVGAAVRSVDGVALGSVTKLEEGNVVIDYSGKPVTLKREYFATDGQGLIVRFTAQALSDALSQQAGG